MRGLAFSATVSRLNPEAPSNKYIPINTMNTNSAIQLNKACRGVGRFAAHLALTVVVTCSARAADIYWARTNSGTGGNWSDSGNWVGGVPPTLSDNAIVFSTNGLITNTVDISTNIQDLTYSWGPITGSTFAEATIYTKVGDGQTLSVLGPTGFVVKHASAGKANTIYNFTGSTLVVSNPTASFVLNSGQTAGGSSSKTQTMDFSGLTNLNAMVNFFGGGNCRLAQGSNFGDQSIKVTLPRTNFIVALWSNDYTGLDFTNSIEIARNDNVNVSGTFSQNSFYKLGYSNAFYADSFGVGRGNAVGGGVTMSSLPGNNLNANGFSILFANSNFDASASSVIFRNTNGVDRMTLVAIGVDSGTNTVQARNTGIMNLYGGRMDMLVDQIWLGRNRTNSAGNSDTGGFSFNNGVVDANTIIAGYMVYTNTTSCGGFLLVGSNGVLKVNKYLELGHTPNDPDPGWAAAQSQTVGQLQVAGSGTAYINQINLGALTTNNTITVGGNGNLVVSNAVGSPDKALTSLTLSGGANLTFAITPGVTNFFVTNLTTSSSAAKLNIYSAPFGVYTAVLINYSGTTQAGNHNFSAVTMPPGLYGRMADDGNNIVIAVTTNAPRNLVWRGTENSIWNHSSTNWFDLNGLTNTAFADGDAVQFDDTPGVPTSISINGVINVAQVGSGIAMTNSTNAFIFTAGGGSLAPAALVKDGSQPFELDVPTALSATIRQGKFVLGVGGTINNVTTSAGTTFTNAGTVTVATSCSGTMLNGATLGSLTLNANAVGTNYSAGIVNGGLSMGSGSQLYNYGGFNNMGNPAVNSNCFLYNAGYLAGTGLNVNSGGTLEDTGTGAYPPQLSFGISSSIAVGSLNINAGGTFIPGGDGIGITRVTEFPLGAPLPSGRLSLAQTSTNIFKVNLDTGTNTTVASSTLTLGQNQSNPLFNGSTLVLNNIGSSSFAVGQSIQLFQNVNNPSGNLASAGANTTNSFPVIVPTYPAPGLIWRLGHLGMDGRIDVADPATLSFHLTNNGIMPVGTNKIAVNLSWAPGGFVQMQVASLTNGLNLAGPWTTVAGSYTNASAILTNDMVTDPVAFFRYVSP